MKKGYNVLSLFGGMECGRVALEKEKIPIKRYFSSEIDKYAMQIANKNYPDIIRLGDVTKWREWDIDFSKIDLLLAGFPCQAWSMAGKQKGDSDPRGALVHDLIDIWNEIKKHNPDVKFLFENVRMKKEFLDYVNNLFGVEPICINSALVSAQNRVRYYWTNIEGIKQPNDKEIFLKDILEDNNEKIGRIVGRKINPETGKRDDYSKTIKTVQRVEPRPDNKSGCLTTVQKDNIVIIDNLYKGRKERIYTEKSPTLRAGRHGLEVRNKSKCVRSGGRDSCDRHEWDSVDNLHIRKLTVLECERLQTLPERVLCVKIDLKELLCIDQAKNFVSVVEKNHKLLKRVLSVEKKELKEYVKLAIESTSVNPQSRKFIVQKNVDMQTQKPIKEYIKDRLGKQRINANSAEKLALSKNQEQEEDFVASNVLMSLIEGRIAPNGKAESPLKDKLSHNQKNGKMLQNLYIKEIMGLARNAGLETTKSKEKNSISTTLSLLSTKNIEQILTILYFFAKSAITGHTARRMKPKNLLLNLTDGYTEGVSNTQRYKMIGNGWTVDVIAHIFKGLIKI